MQQRGPENFFTPIFLCKREKIDEEFSLKKLNRISFKLNKK